MSPEKQRIVIAEASEWTYEPEEVCGVIYPWLSESGDSYQELPDYLGDLNTCHEFEKTLSEEQKLKYYHYICVAVRKENGQSDHESIYAPLHTTHATATQRAEAFLRTIGKWEESE